MGRIIGIDLGTTNSCVAILEGDKVKVNIRFKGREMSHQELGVEMAKRIETDLVEEAVIESRPRLEGRQMIMMIAPKKK
jgi:translation initiation factor IF-3